MVRAAIATGLATHSHLRIKQGGGQGRNETRRAHSPQPRVAPHRNLGDATVFCHAVSELLLADALTKLVVARKRRLRRPDRKSPRRLVRPMLNLELYVRPPSAHAIGCMKIKKLRFHLCTV